jgi:hypothetical protein
MERNSEKLAVKLNFLVFGGSIICIVAWIFGMPLFYDPNGPVMSIFTAISLFIISGNRLAKRYFALWPFTQSIAFLLIVGGGNLSSLLMLVSAPKVHINSSSSLVMTSIFTSVGFIFFSVYEILYTLRKTPKSKFILDDILIHLALVPGELSLIGHLFNNPTYLSMGLDPRVGISILEMCFMAALAASTIFANQSLFLWQFLKGGISNQTIFSIFFANQYIAPVLYLLFFGADFHNQTYGAELFIMIGGVLATLGFLVSQSYAQNRLAS